MVLGPNGSARARSVPKSRTGPGPEPIKPTHNQKMKVPEILKNHLSLHHITLPERGGGGGGGGGEQVNQRSSFVYRRKDMRVPFAAWISCSAVGAIQISAWEACSRGAGPRMLDCGCTFVWKSTIQNRVVRLVRFSSSLGVCQVNG